MKAYINPKLREVLDDPKRALEYAKKLGRVQRSSSNIDQETNPEEIAAEQEDDSKLKKPSS
jgi:hypothetical protein